ARSSRSPSFQRLMRILPMGRPPSSVACTKAKVMVVGVTPSTLGVDRGPGRRASSSFTSTEPLPRKFWASHVYVPNRSGKLGDTCVTLAPGLFSTLKYWLTRSCRGCLR
ncbi:unnamed protein product, partial [Ixodes pacificus]